MQLDVEVSPPALVREFLKNIDRLLMEFNSSILCYYMNYFLPFRLSPDRVQTDYRQKAIHMSQPCNCTGGLNKTSFGLVQKQAQIKCVLLAVAQSRSLHEAYFCESCFRDAIYQHFNCYRERVQLEEQAMPAPNNGISMRRL